MAWLAAALAMFAVIASASRACADDSSPGVSLPGWRAEPPDSVTVTAANVVLDGDNMTVTMTLAGGRARASRLVLTTPRFGWLGEGEPYPDRQFPELAVSFGGRPLPMESGFRAFAGTNDVTSLLAAARLDPFAVALTPPYLEPSDPSQQALKALEAAGAVRRTDGKNLAAWSAERTVAVTVPPGGEAVLATAWRARPAFDYLPTAAQGSGPDLAPFCLDAPRLAGLAGTPADTRPLMAREYAIPVGVGASLPAAVTVSVDGAAQDGGKRLLVAACDGEGRPIIGKARLSGARLRPSADGVVHILTVGDAAAHD